MSERLIATVKRGKERKTREGRGFSQKELRSVGLSLGHALKMGIGVDKHRRSIHEENVKLLKEYLAKLEESKAPAEAVRKGKRKTRKSEKPVKEKQE